MLLSSGNLAPVADAGPDQTVTGATALLDAAGSTDANGDPLAFRWAALSMAVADFNGDGLDDIIGGMQLGFGGRAQVFLGSASGTLVPGPVLSTVHIANNVLAADFTGDGAADVMLVSPRSAGVWLYTNDGAGNFGTGVFTLVSSAMIGLLNRVSAAGGINRRRRSNLRKIV